MDAEVGRDHFCSRPESRNELVFPFQKMANRGVHVVRQFWDTLEIRVKSFLTPQPNVCVQCHQALGSAGYCAQLRDGIDLEFCSQNCAFNYWEDYKRYCETTAGRRVCGLPGCSKPCYREGSKVHDYCGRTHAKEHKSMMEAMARGRRKQHNGGGGSGGGFFSGSSGFFNRSGPIKFYNRGEKYYEFTNFYEVEIRIDGKDWLTTEHYFQAQKFVGTPLLETIRMLSRPREAFNMSRDPRYSRWRRSDWEQVKEDVMYKALQAKFSQHKHLRQMLLETGKRELIEHSPHDSYWGDGGDGTGKNRLGHLLMKLRGEMKASNSKKKETRPSAHSVAKHPEASDKQPIEHSFKPTDKSDSSEEEGEGSGGTGPCGQPTKPNSSDHGHKWSPEHGHTHQHDSGHSAKEPVVVSTENSSCRDATVIANTGAMTQPTSTATQSHPVIFTPSPHTGGSTPTVTSATQSNPFFLLQPNQSLQQPHTRASGTPGPLGPLNQQLQQVPQPSSAPGHTHMTHPSSSAPVASTTAPSYPSGMGSAVLNPTPPPGLVQSLDGTSLTPSTSAPQIHSQASNMAYAQCGTQTQWNAGQLSSNVSIPSSTTTMPQGPLQPAPMKIGSVDYHPTSQPAVPPGPTQLPGSTPMPIQAPNPSLPPHMVQRPFCPTPNGAHPQCSQAHVVTPPPGFHAMQGGMSAQGSFPYPQQQPNAHQYAQQQASTHQHAQGSFPYPQQQADVQQYAQQQADAHQYAQGSFSYPQQQANAHQYQYNPTMNEGKNGNGEPMDTSV